MIRSLIVIALLACTSVASGTSVSYSVSNINGITWHATYTIVNDTLAVPIEEITIYFDNGLYANLSTVADAPIGWDSLVVQPDSNLPADGFFDSLALGSGIVPGASLGGFSVTFDFLGTGIPEAQFWQVVDPTTFAVIDQGTSLVPVPAALWLFLSGLLAIRAVGGGRSLAKDTI